MSIVYKWLNISSNFFSRPDRPTILVLRAIWGYSISREPLSDGVKYTGLGKFPISTEIAV